MNVLLFTISNPFFTHAKESSKAVVPVTCPLYHGDIS